MADEVKLYAAEVSPFVFRAKVALNMKGIQYQNLEQDLSNKSAELLKYNPVYKKVPVLVHNGNAISESLVIVEYIDDAWKGVPILPQDPYEKAVARFWAKFIDDKCIPALHKAFGLDGNEKTDKEASDLKGNENTDKEPSDLKGNEKTDKEPSDLKGNKKTDKEPSDLKGNEKTDKEACDQLQILENELKVKGTKFFGGDNINLVDIAADYIAYWVGIIQEATGKTLVTKDKFPTITVWADDFVNLEVVNQVLPPREHLLAFFKKKHGKA